MRAAVITISTSRARGHDADRSGPALVEFVHSLGGEVIGQELIADDRALIESRLRHWTDEAECQLVLTTGGTGFAQDDVTPEATQAVIEREAPGIAEAMRAASRERTPHWMLSRGIAGLRGRSLIINFPGNPESIDQAGQAVRDALPHALDLLGGRPSEHRSRT